MNKMTSSALALALLLAGSCGAMAQTDNNAAPAAPPPAADQSQQLLSAGELDALVAPIALYPDSLVAEVLMASTYPLEVVEAQRWAAANKNLQGDQLKGAVDKQSWDNSVKSLVATPSVLDMMSEKLDWTQKLGDAVLAQQPDVMDAIQRLRLKAQANNKLASTPQQTVTTQQQEGKQVIVIAPTQPDTMYVPYYDPGVVYGAWAYPDYPPYYFGAPGYIAGGLLATGLAFGAGYALGRWGYGGYGWGGGMGWGNNNINVSRNFNNVNINNRNWSHDSVHRQGVRYNNANVAQRFGGNNLAGGAQARADFRGRGGAQGLQPGNRPNVGGGAAAGNRPNISNLNPGNRPNAGNRPSAGNRPAAGNRPNVGNRPAAVNRPSAGGNRPSGGGFNRPAGGNAFGNIGSGNRASFDANRGHASLGGGGFGGGGGGARFGGGGGGGRGGGGGGGVRRRSDMRLKHDIVLLGHLDDGLGFYRFTYNGGRQRYVGVIAQEVKRILPEAVVRGRDGYLRVDYAKLNLTFQTYAEWIAAGARVPTGEPEASPDAARLQ
jgi:Protein of unknown function (DUF3300)/Chaperone of endosialidase